MTVGVYGLGRFGSFWASCLSRNMRVKAYSRNPDRVVADSVERTTEDDVLACDALFLCVAISAMEQVVGKIAGRLREDAVVLDTCSVKSYPVRLMERLLPANVSIIGTHPMFGPDSGREGIGGLPIVFCPVRASEDRQSQWRTIFSDMGLVVHSLTPDEHDREVAYTQGVTHLMGRVLDDLNLSRSAIGTVGYHKLLEIIEQTCNDPYQLFVDLQRYNDYTGEMRRKLDASFRKVENDLSRYLDTRNGGR